MQACSEHRGEHSLSQLHIYGVYARATNAMLHTTQLPALKTLISDFMSELELTGVIRIFANTTDKATLKFGAKPERFIYQHTLKIQEFMLGDQKISACDKHLLFSNNTIFAFCDLNERSHQSRETLQEILSLFFDSLSTWLTQWRAKEALTEKLHATLDTTIDASEKLIEKYLSTTEDLAFDLTKYFLTLGLDSDQETLVLDALRQSSYKQAHLIEQEIQRNTKLGDTLITAVGELTNPQPKQPASRISSVELF